MKLSEAILLGDTLRERASHDYLYTCNGKVCGCALGGALLSSGFTMADFRISISGMSPTDIIRRFWPWFTPEHNRHISVKFSKVCNGKMSMEQLVDYVRSIEPEEREELEEPESEKLGKERNGQETVVETR